MKYKLVTIITNRFSTNDQTQAQQELKEVPIHNYILICDISSFTGRFTFLFCFLTNKTLLFYRSVLHRHRKAQKMLLHSSEGLRNEKSSKTSNILIQRSFFPDFVLADDHWILDMVIKLPQIKLRRTFATVLEFAPRCYVCLRHCFSFCGFKLHSSAKDDTKERPTWPNHMLSYAVCMYFWQNCVYVAMDQVLKEKNQQKTIPFTEQEPN